MNKSILTLGAIAVLALTSCKKTEVVDTTVAGDSLAPVMIVDNDSLPITNDSTVVAVDDAAKKAKNSTEEAIKDGAAAVKETAKDATDGDGNITK